MSKAKWTSCEGVHWLKGERCEVSLITWGENADVTVRIDGKWHHSYRRRDSLASVKRHARVLFNAIEGKS